MRNTISTPVIILLLFFAGFIGYRTVEKIANYEPPRWRMRRFYYVVRR